MRTLAPMAALASLAGLAFAQPAAPPADTKPANTNPMGTEPADPALRAGADPLPDPDRKLPLGWLSDPALPPEGLADALFGGKIHLDNNLRIELAGTTGRDSSTAITNRLRLGYETKPLHGFNAFVEMEHVASPDRGNYFVPATGDGTPSRTVVADPVGIEVNQAYGRYRIDPGDGLSLDIKAGRQRIKLDDDRFIGNVGWRQFEQTFDSASIRTDLGVDRLGVFYAYVWGVQRIFGPDGPNPDSDSHLVNISYRIAPEATLTPFAYLLDFGDDDPANSSNSFGLRVSGDLFKSNDAADLFADYQVTIARQTDAGSNPTDYEADFFALQARVTKKGLGYAVAGYQFLGSDEGAFAFRFPLGTNHAFQGFADNFLVTPAAGLQDLYLGLGADLPWGVKGAVTYHRFWSDSGSMDFGDEIDLVASKKITPNWSVLLKGAYYDGDSGQPDTARFWAQTTFAF